MKPGADANTALVGHMRECLLLIAEYTGHERTKFEASRMVQRAVIRDLQRLAESSQRLSDSIKAAEPQVPWRERAGFRKVLVHGYLGIDIAAVLTNAPIIERAVEQIDLFAAAAGEAFRLDDAAHQPDAGPSPAGNSSA